MVETRTRITGRLVMGLIVMALGVIWTLDNLGVVESEPILGFWPVVLIVIGVAKLVGLGTSRHIVWGAVFLVIGAWLLGSTLGLLDVGFWDLWPLILVGVGLSLLSRARGPESPQGVTEEPSSVIHSFACWSHVRRRVVSQTFRGGDATALMGGVTIDFDGAKPLEGGAVVDLFVWWGGVDLKIPEHWKVVNEATVLMGGIEDKAKQAPGDSKDVLILRGLVLMGGVEIKN